MFSKLSLKVKMLSSFVGISLLLIVVGGLGWHTNKKVSALYEVVGTDKLGNIQMLGKMQFEASEASRLMLLSVLSKTPQEVDENKSLFDQALLTYQQFDKKYQDIPFVAGEEALYGKVADSWKKYNAKMTEVFGFAKNPEKRVGLDTYVLTEIPPFRKEFTSSLDALIRFQDDQAAAAKKEAAETRAQGETLVMIAIAFGFILSSSLGFIFASALAKTLGRISEEISSAADQTSSSGSQLSAASQQLSSGSSEAASSLEETVASLEELSSMVKVNADHAKEANNLSKASSSSAEHGESEINKLIAAMEDMARGSKKIEEIITVIDDIAFQTNLLALNAAVEAARAGGTREGVCGCG